MAAQGMISEIFHSIQGEGLYLGWPQVFIRLDGCNLHECVYCDTPQGRRGTFLDTETVLTRVREILAVETDTVLIGITGGEPLHQPAFVKNLLCGIKKLDGSFTYLETNGTLPDVLSDVVDVVDIIAMDMKLPSSTGLEPMWKTHSDFLAVAQHKVFVKAVVTDSTTEDDMRTCAETIRTIDPQIALVIQPEWKGDRESIARNRLYTLQDIAENFLETVIVIPQVHKRLRIP